MYLLKAWEDILVNVKKSFRNFPSQEDDLDLSPNWQYEEKLITTYTPKEEPMGPVETKTESCPHEDEITELKQNLGKLWNLNNKLVREVNELRKENRKEKLGELHTLLEKVTNKKLKEELMDKYYEIEFGELYRSNELQQEDNPYDTPSGIRAGHGIY